LFVESEKRFQKVSHGSNLKPGAGELGYGDFYQVAALTWKMNMDPDSKRKYTYTYWEGS